MRVSNHEGPPFRPASPFETPACAGSSELVKLSGFADVSSAGKFGRIVAKMRPGWLVLGAGKPMALEDVVGEGVPEHSGTDLFDAAYGQEPQVPVAPASMDAFAD